LIGKQSLRAASISPKPLRKRTLRISLLSSQRGLLVTILKIGRSIENIAEVYRKKQTIAAKKKP
jgi:hypothetical protein